MYPQDAKPPSRCPTILTDTLQAFVFKILAMSLRKFDIPDLCYRNTPMFAGLSPLGLTITQQIAGTHNTVKLTPPEFALKWWLFRLRVMHFIARIRRFRCRETCSVTWQTG